MKPALSANRLGAYTWRLEVEVWSNHHLTKVDRQITKRPSLTLIAAAVTEEGRSAERLCGKIGYDPAGWRKREGRWLVDFYPSALEAVLRGTGLEEIYRYTLSPESVEVQNPRDTETEALKLLLTHLQEEIGPSSHEALAQTGPLFLPILKQMTNAWLTRHRPKKDL